jgi:hypothetical protein
VAAGPQLWPRLLQPSLLLDLKVDKDWAVRTKLRLRFYTDPTDTVPIAVPERPAIYLRFRDISSNRHKKFGWCTDLCVTIASRPKS